MIMANPAMLPPGFRFHPTDEELILHYLRNRAANAGCPVDIIADVDIYKFDPWDLPCSYPPSPPQLLRHSHHIMMDRSIHACTCWLLLIEIRTARYLIDPYDDQ